MDKKVLQRATEMIGWLLSEEEIVEVVEFFKNSIILTNKRFIYIDVALAKNKQYSIIPYRSITGFTFKEATGFSAKSGLRIMAGGDNPIMEIEVIFDDKFKNLCKTLNKYIA